MIFCHGLARTVMHIDGPSPGIIVAKWGKVSGGGATGRDSNVEVPTKKLLRKLL